MKKYLLLFLLLIGCGDMKNKEIQYRDDISTIYPISTSTQCKTVPREKQVLFLKNFAKLRLGMSSNEVVDLLEVTPYSYKPNESKAINAPISHYVMSYCLDCSDDNNSISIIFTPEEKLKKIFVGENINIPNVDSKLTIE